MPLAFLCAAAKAGNQAVTKPLVARLGTLRVAVYGNGACFLLLLPLALVPGAISIPPDPSFHGAAWVTILCNVAASVLIVEAIRISDLSYSMPFLAVTPLLTVGTAWLLRGETVAVAGALAVGMMVLGALAVGSRSPRDWLALGGRRVLRSRGTRLVLLVAGIYSISSVFDKTATLRSDPLTFVLYSATGRAVLLAVVLLVVLRRGGRPQPEEPEEQDRNVIDRRSRAGVFLLVLLVGLSFAAESILHVEALARGPVPYVLSIKRMSVLLASLLGMLFLGEPFRIARLLGAALMVGGATMLYLVGR